MTRSIPARILSILVALGLAIVSLVACGDGGSPSASGSPTGEPTPGNGEELAAEDLSQKIVLSWMIPTQQALSLAESPLFKAICEATNVEFELTELPVSQHEEKKKLFITSKTIPDILSFMSPAEANTWGPEGAFAELSGLLETYIPSFDRELKDNWEDRYVMFNTENQLYLLPHVMYNAVPIFDFSYNADAFAAVGYPEPATMDELHLALKALKEKEPDYYPLGFRNHYEGVSKCLELFVMAFTGGKGSSISGNLMGFDAEADRFVFMPALPGFRSAVAYFATLYTEGLVDPEYSIADEGMLKERIRKGKTKMIADFIGGWTGIVSLDEYTNHVLKPLPIPQAEGQPRIIDHEIPRFEGRGSVVSGLVDRKSLKFRRILTVLDYIYSEEFYRIQWFHPDVATDNGDGTYTYKPVVYDTTGDYMRLKDLYFPWSLRALFQDSCDERPLPGSPYQVYRDEYLLNPDNANLYTPFPVVPFTTEQQARVSELANAVSDRYRAQISEFAEGKKPMSEWDAFVANLQEAGGTEIESIYAEAYAALKGN